MQDQTIHYKWTDNSSPNGTEVLEGSVEGMGGACFFCSLVFLIQTEIVHEVTPQISEIGCNAVYASPKHQSNRTKEWRFTACFVSIRPQRISKQIVCHPDGPEN